MAFLACRAILDVERACQHHRNRRRCDRPFFRPDISPVGADRASVMRCRRSLLLAGGCCCCCHRCCQAAGPSCSPSPRLLPGAVTAPCPAQAPPPNPTAAEPDGRRVLSRGGVADHEVTPQAPLTGSGCREHSYGGFGGGHSHFHPHNADLRITSRLLRGLQVRRPHPLHAHRGGLLVAITGPLMAVRAHFGDTPQKP